MIRVGYPASLDPELFRDFPLGIDLVPLADGLDGNIDIEVWIPDPYPTRALRIWPQLRGVRLILCLMAGTDWIPVDIEAHVTVCNARGAHSISTAEWAVSATLAMLKHFPLYHDLQCAGDWRGRKRATSEYERITRSTPGQHPPVLLEELAEKRVLLVGYGAIGQEIERILAPFHVELTRVARSSRTEPLVHSVDAMDGLIPEADVIMLALPLNSESRGLIGPRQFALMRQGALLVNAARGPVVDTDALVAALKDERIRAALDVTDPEPLPSDHPLWQCPNLLITPHVAASSPAFAPRAMRIAAEELRRYVNGEPLRNVVQPAS